MSNEVEECTFLQAHYGFVCDATTHAKKTDYTHFAVSESETDCTNFCKELKM
jgi:hypothetical protein